MTVNIPYYVAVGGFYVPGQSWGGTLAGTYAASRLGDLLKLVISGSSASFSLFIECGKRQREQLPHEVREASAIFYPKDVYRIPMPEEAQQAFRNYKTTPISYYTMQGSLGILVNGNLKDWDSSEYAKNINVDTLLLNGRYDEVEELCIEIWFRSIPRIKCVMLENSSHMFHWEENERFMQLQFQEPYVLDEYCAEHSMNALTLGELRAADEGGAYAEYEEVPYTDLSHLPESQPDDAYAEGVSTYEVGANIIVDEETAIDELGIEDNTSARDNVDWTLEIEASICQNGDLQAEIESILQNQHQLASDLGEDTDMVGDVGGILETSGN
ncbi:hypothetical protein NUW58_g8418 [Xylaria curta]|uniref:Uncharacterized protein n=1 Tax=Xylaria curta TaxID=42375 RepID=A0ACC1N8A2_9PEZI|nr:hypothetical protein NUW58_g8418 [Xylaria curta]